MITLYESATHLVVTGQPDEINQLAEDFQFRPEGYFYSPLYERYRVTKGKEGWDGYLRPFQKMTASGGRILRGRKQELIGLCGAHGFKVDTKKLLVSPFSDLQLADVLPDLIAGNFQLDEYQRQSIHRWLVSGIGMAKITVSGGKTATYGGAAVLIKSRFPDARFLYITPAERLVKQVTKEMKKFLPDWDIGQFGGGIKQHQAKDMVVCTVAMLNHHYNALKGKKWFDTFLGLFMDECITGDALITKADGSLERIQTIAERGETVEVKTVNESTGIIENKTAFGLIKNKRAVLVIRLYNDVVLRCTPEHLVFTLRGWIAARDLKLNDSIYYDARARTVGLRKPARGCLHGNGGALFVSTVKDKSQPEAVGFGECKVRLVEKLHRNATQDHTQWWVGRPVIFFLHVKPAGIFRGMENSVLWQAENNNGNVAVSDHTRRSGLVVYGRWKPCDLWHKSFNRKLFKERKFDVKGLAQPAMGHPTGSNACEAQLVVSSISKERSRHLLSFGGTLCIAGNALQAVLWKLENLFGLRCSIFADYPLTSSLFSAKMPEIGKSTEPTKFKSILPSKVFKKSKMDTGTGQVKKAGSSRTKNLFYMPETIPHYSQSSSLLRKRGMFKNHAPNEQYVKVRSVEVAGIESVYDLTVADNHNYFANGCLVHNCHHAGSKSFQRVVLAVPAFFRLGASDSIKEDDQTRYNAIVGLCGPVLNEVCAAPLMERGRLAKPHIYVVDIPEWHNKFRDVDYRPSPQSRAFVLSEGEWKKATYLGPVHEEDDKGNVKTRKVKTADREEDGEWITVDEPVIIQGLHRIQFEGEEEEREVESRWCLLDRIYDRAIIQFKPRNDLIVQWAKAYSGAGLPTLVVCTRILHIYILEALLKAAIKPELVDILFGRDTPTTRDSRFEWFRNTPGAVLISPLVKEGVSINEIQAGVIADYVSDWEVANQIVGRFLRKKMGPDNRAHITVFRDRQHPVLRRGCNAVFQQLEKIQGYTFYDPAPTPEEWQQARLQESSGK